MKPEAITDNTKTDTGSNKLGLALLLAPFVLMAVGSIGLYLWIVSNGYQGDQSVFYAWLVYAVSFLAYLGPIILGASLVSIVAGIVLMVSGK